MNSTPNLVTWTVAALLAAVAAGCNTLQKPTARITGANLQDVGLTSAMMVFDVEVDNPYSVPLPLGNLDYTLSSRGQQFLAGQADLQGEVPAGASKRLGLPVSISYAELIRAVEGARPGSTIPYAADLGLSVETPLLGPVRLPMGREGQIAIPSAPGLLEQFRSLSR
jgi:LEA14-like dessication related protein